MNKQKINWMDTIVHIWIGSLFTSLYIGAVWFSAENIGKAVEIKEILFWGFITLFIIQEGGMRLSKEKFVKYKGEKKE